MAGTTFEVRNADEDGELLALAWSSNDWSRQLYAVSHSLLDPVQGLFVALGANGSQSAQFLRAFNNVDNCLHTASPSSFAEWAAEEMGAAVVVFELIGTLGGRWPANPNVVSVWDTWDVKRGDVLLGIRYVAAERQFLEFAWRDRESFDSAPANAVVMLFALRPVDDHGQTSAIVGFPPYVPSIGAPSLNYSLTTGGPLEPSYGFASNAIASPAVQYYYTGQWRQLFVGSPVLQSVAGITNIGSKWLTVAAPFDGIAPAEFRSFVVMNKGEGAMELRFGPGAQHVMQIGPGDDLKFGFDEGLASGTVVIDKYSRLQIRSVDPADAESYEVLFRFADASTGSGEHDKRGHGGCGCGG